MTDKEILKIFSGTCWNIISGKMFILSSFYLVCIIAMTIKLFAKRGIMLSDEEWLKETRTDEFVYVFFYTTYLSFIICLGLMTTKEYCQAIFKYDYCSIHGIDLRDVVERINYDYKN